MAACEHAATTEAGACANAMPAMSDQINRMETKRFKRRKPISAHESASIPFAPQAVTLQRHTEFNGECRRAGSSARRQHRARFATPLRSMVGNTG